jgi:flagellar biosynthetic protein FliR
MPADSLGIWSAGGAFLLTAARIGSAFAFFPLPGWRAAADPARILFVLALSASLAPLRSDLRLPADAGALALWLASELAFGLADGLIVGFVAEGLLLAAQTVSMQAGYSFATAFDPNSQADSGVIQLFFTLGANLLLFASGLDHAMIRVFALSLEKWPAGLPHLDLAPLVVRFSAAALESGVRLALPIAGFLFLTDLFLALAARLHSQLQLLSVAFPIKMLATLAGIALLAPAICQLYRVAAGRAERLLDALVR